MKKVIAHIEHIKGKPHHIRKRVALGVATGVSGLVAFVWLAGNLSAGSFAIAGSSFDASTGQQAAIVVTTNEAGDVQGLAGAAAALEDKKAPAHIEIVDTTPAPVKKQSDQTILPF